LAVTEEGDIELGEGTLTPRTGRLTKELENQRELTNLVGRSLDDAWAVTTKNGPFASEIHHRENGQWRLATSFRDRVVLVAPFWNDGAVVAFVEPLAGVRGPGATLVAVGKSGRIAPVLTPSKWAGAVSATGEPPGCTTRVGVRDLLGFPSGDLFAVGEPCDEADDGRVLIEHFDSHGKRKVEPLPGASVSGRPSRPDLRGKSPTAVCVGFNVSRNSGPYVARFDGERWTQLSMPPENDTHKLVGLDCSGDDVWIIVQSASNKTTLYRRLATTAWEAQPLPVWKGVGPMNAIDVAAWGHGGAWIIGQSPSAEGPRSPSAILSLKLQ
jgi:hypothetical protein